ncbi:MAG: hypothetical protein QOD86_340 [Miltoncostaeaceae bacterium]|jgi:catechol 2,3-dioxygenase-like lactoylglutathione lyase family enzyme|nr:hypothetical protein [Miltoncostaeaceae bacterium]
MFADTQAYSGFAVGDFAAARAFYAETLGLRVTTLSEEGGLMQLELAGDRPTLIYAKADHVPAVFTILNFIVDDIDAAVDGLAARGVTFERYEGFDQDERGIARGQGPDIAWFTDPSGNILSVHTPM